MDTMKAIAFLLTLLTPCGAGFLMSLNQSIAEPEAWMWIALAWSMGLATVVIFFWAVWLLFFKRPKRYEEISWLRS